MRAFLKALIVVTGIGFCAFVQTAKAAETACAPIAELNFLCNADKPEDLARIPGTRWLIASGFSAGAGLKLVDMKTKTLVRWYLGAVDQVRPDPVLYSDCTTAPDPALFNARGISLRMQSRRQGTLHVVNHGGREAVEVFAVSLEKSRPELRWQGCLLLPPAHVGNAVATYSDGTVLVSVLTRPGMTITDFERGENTGGVYQRGPGDAFFSLIPGTELPGNNGLETAPDDSGFYTVAFGMRAVALFDRRKQTGPQAIAKAPGFMPDNIHWDGKRLIAAGMVTDEPNCGGTRKIVDGVADRMLCHRGYVVAALDPATSRWAVIARGNANEGHNGVSSAILNGRELWIGSYQADRLAWRTLKRPKK